jgi:hypothetical protein
MPPKQYALRLGRCSNEMFVQFLYVFPQKAPAGEFQNWRLASELAAPVRGAGGGTRRLGCGSAAAAGGGTVVARARAKFEENVQFAQRWRSVRARARQQCKIAQGNVCVHNNRSPCNGGTIRHHDKTTRCKIA